MPTATSADLQDQLAGLVADPLRFVRGILGHTIWETPAAILQAVAVDPLVAVRSCHASGKTFTAAEALLWWITRYEDGIVISTAPTWLQVETLLWGEVRKALPGSKIAYPEPNQTELKLSEGNYAIGLSTNEGVRFQGFHGKHVLIILDEAPGVKGDIWEAIEGVRAGGNVHVLAIGNPVVAAGSFFDAFHKERQRWRTFTISALDTPNLRGITIPQLLAMDDEQLNSNQYPYLVTRRWVRDMVIKCGGYPACMESDLFRARVLGQFPKQGSNSLISLEWVEAALRNRLAPGGLMEAGLDVARFGNDETALYLQQAGKRVGEWAWQNADTMQTAGRVGQVLAPYRQQLTALKVDVIGLGAGVADRLRELGWPVVDVNVSLPPDWQARSGLVQFENRRAQYWWGLREMLRCGQIAGDIDQQTQSELVQVLYGINSSGKVYIESKEDAKKRGVASPNRADAMMLAHAPAAPRASSGTNRRTVEVNAR